MWPSEAAVKLESGEVICESEIVCEYIDSVSSSDSSPLVPRDPLVASRMRISMKKFNPVGPAMVGLLKNQDPERDSERIAEIEKHLDAFVKTLEVGGTFCHSSVPTLADCHCAPFLYRCGAFLRHWRNYDYLEKYPRLRDLMTAVTDLPEWKAVLAPGACSKEGITEEKLCAFYEQYANDGKWGKSADGSAVLVGRGKRLKIA